MVPDRSRYSVGDTATVLFASPFTDAEAWVTVEREGLIEQRRLKLTAGATTLKFPITEKYRSQRLRVGAGRPRAERAPGAAR